jgi:uncharacterized membrane protein
MSEGLIDKKRRRLLRRYLRAAVQHVAETTVQPRLASCVVVLGVKRFVVDVRKVATQAGNLLREAALSLGHEFSIALIPQFITVSYCSRDAAAVSLDRVFCYQFGLEWWQLAMPVHDLWFVVFNGVFT